MTKNPIPDVLKFIAQNKLDVSKNQLPGEVVFLMKYPYRSVTVDQINKLSTMFFADRVIIDTEGSAPILKIFYKEPNGKP